MQLQPKLRCISLGIKCKSDINLLEQSLSERLGANVAIKHRNDGRGSVTIHYSSLDELDGILEHIK